MGLACYSVWFLAFPLCRANQRPALQGCQAGNRPAKEQEKKKIFAFGAELNELNVIVRLQSNTKTRLKLGQSCLPSVYTRGTINTDMTNGAGQVMESRRVNGSKETQSTGRCEHKFTPPMLKPGSSTPDRHLTLAQYSRSAFINPGDHLCYHQLEIHQCLLLS